LQEHKKVRDERRRHSKIWLEKKQRGG
jgi:hypothetical protein